MPLINPPVLQYVDTDGTPWRFAKAYVTDSGTTTPAVVYQDEEFTTPHEYPIVADAQGLFPPIHFNPILGLLRMRVIPEDGDLAEPPIDADPVNQIATVIGDLVIAVPGNPSGESTWLGGMVFNRASRISFDLVGWRGKPPKSAPTADYAVVFKFYEKLTDTTTTIGTITCDHTTKEWTISDTGLDDILPVDGDELDAYGPVDDDPAIADFGFTCAIALR